MSGDAIDSLLAGLISTSSQVPTAFHDAQELSSLLVSLFNSIKQLSKIKPETLPDIWSQQSIFPNLRYFLVSGEKDIRVAGLRTVRYSLILPKALELIQDCSLHLFALRAFETEGRNQERIELCKIMRQWIEIDPGSFPKSYASALVAVAETENEEFRDVALEFLRYLSILNTPIVAWSGGFRCLLTALLEGKCQPAASENIILSFLYLLNEPKTREYLKPNIEFSRLFSVFTELETGLKESEADAQMKMSKNAIVLMSRTWPGLIYLASSGLKAMIQSLVQPVAQEVKEAILDTVYEMLTVAADSTQQAHNLLNNYLAMLLQALLYCDLHTSLTHLAIKDGTYLADKARKLLRSVNKIAADLLPEVPQFPLMLDTTNAGKAAEIVADMDSAMRFQRLPDDSNLLVVSCEFVSFENTRGVSSSNWVLSGIYQQHLINSIDDSAFVQQLNRSNVSKEPQRWEWSLINDIVAGPLSSPSRFQVALRTKFLKGLLVYFLPSKRLFVELEWHSSNFVQARVGSLLISLLLSQDEGQQLLRSAFSEGFFVSRKSYMEELADTLDEELAFMETRTNSASRVLTPEMMRGFMAREYFKWIGLFTSSRAGRKLIKAYQIDTKLMRLAGADHLTPVLLPQLDYRDPTSRDFLSFAMQSKSQFIRKNSMEHLRLLYRSGTFDLSWAIRELVNHLYSADVESTRCALSVLDELCQDRENLKAFIATGPQALTNLGERGTKFLIRFLSSSSGFEYLVNFPFIDKEMERWKTQANYDYAEQIEKDIENGLNSPKKKYSLAIPTPLEYQNGEYIEISWIRKLPFAIVLNIERDMNVLRSSQDVFVELTDTQDVLISTRLEGIAISPGDAVNVCLTLGPRFIDSKGRETTAEDWIRCTKEDRSKELQLIDAKSGIIIEKEGVMFEFVQKQESGFELVLVAFRVELMPKAPPSIIIPTHLYGELVKTKMGLRKLQQTEHIVQLLNDLKSDLPGIKKRAALWALGHTGCTERGCAYLIRLKSVEKLVKIAEQSPILSLRGTAYQALSLISKSNKGKQELLRLGWASPEHQNSTISMPLDPTTFFTIAPYQCQGYYADHLQSFDQYQAANAMTADEQEIVNNIASLGNVVTRPQSETFLRTRRAQSPEAFNNPKIFSVAISILSHYSFKLNARRIFHKILDKAPRSAGFLPAFDQLPKPLI